MNIKPYEEKKNTDPKDTIYLRLISDKKVEEVDLCITTNNGDVIGRGVLLSITKDVSIRRQPSVNSMIETDHSGRIIVVD